MVRAWRLYQGGMGARVLPDPGGALQQPAVMIEAFEFMSMVEAKIGKGCVDD